jgi:hypothetical protein
MASQDEEGPYKKARLFGYVVIHFQSMNSPILTKVRIIDRCEK